MCVAVCVHVSLSEALDMCVAENVVVKENMAKSLTPVKSRVGELYCVFSSLCSTMLRIKAN